MTCTTFLHDSQLNVPTSNEDINTLLKQVRRETGEDWQIIERNHIELGFWPFVRPSKLVYYELYKFVGGCGPWQVMNFYRDNSTSSINFGISSEMVMAYLYGVLAGLDVGERKTWKNQ